MSLDLSKLTPKSNLIEPTENVELSYTFKKQRLGNQLLRKLKTTSDLPVRIRVGFLNEEDKIYLEQDICNKGYICSVENGTLTIQ